MRLTAARGLACLTEVLQGFGGQPGAGLLRLGQTTLGLPGDVQLLVEVLRGRVGLLGLGDAEVEGFVDQGPPVQVVPVHEGDGHAGVAGATGATDPVHVGLLVLRALVVDDVGDVLDIDASGRDIGGDQDVDLAGPEGAQCLLAGALSEVAVQGGGGETALGEVIGHLGGGALGAAEDDRQAASAGLEDAREHLGLVHRVRAIDELADRLDRLAGVTLGLRHGADVRRLGHVAAGQRHDGTGHGRREEHRVTVRRGHRQDLLDIGKEAQVQHLVGLVEDDGAGTGEVQVALLGQVDEASGCADDHLDAALQGVDLRLEGAPAVDGEHADAAAFAGPLEVGGHLHGELTGGGDGQRLRLARVREVSPLGITGGHDALQERDAEAERLAGAGLGLADDVVAAQGHRQRHRLDWERVGDPVIGQGGDDVGVDREIAEGLLCGVGQGNSVDRACGGARRRLRKCGPIGGLLGRLAPS